MPSTDNPTTGLAQRPGTLAILLLLVIAGLGIFVRVESIFTWQVRSDIFFTGDQPVLTDVDGYYYLNIAKELGEQSYSTIDGKRAFPEGINRAERPPLLSVLLHQISAVSGLSLNWVAIWLPVILSITLLVPVFFFGHYFGSMHGAIGAVAVAALAPYFAERNRLSQMDTDSLNLVLPLCCAYLFMRFGTTATARRYGYLAGGLFCYALFLWWWDMSPQAAMLLALSPLAIALLCHYRPPAKEAILFGGLALIALLTFNWYVDIFALLVQYGKTAMTILAYISKEAPGIFPNIGESIAEQQRFGFIEVLVRNIANLGCLLLALIGLVMLALREKTKVLYLLPMAVIGTFGFFFAMRFTFFLTPLLAIGFGSFFATMYPKIDRKYLYYGCYGLALASLAWASIGQTRYFLPAFRGEIITGMARIKEITPENALIWSWGDEGHPLVYWSGRATVNDGMVHGGERDYFTALPMAGDDFRFAANFMQFYAVHGRPEITAFMQSTGSSFAQGMGHLRTILRSGPESGKEFLESLTFTGEDNKRFSDISYYYPNTAPPIYLFLDSRMPQAFRWIYWYGTWDTEKQAGTPTLPTLHLQDISYDHHNVPLGKGIELNTEEGWITIAGTLPGKNPIQSIAIQGGSHQRRQMEYAVFSGVKEQKFTFENFQPDFIANQNKFTDTGIYTIQLLPDKKELLLQDKKISHSVLNYLFNYGTADPGNYFSPVELAEHYQIWEVHGDKPLP